MYKVIRWSGLLRCALIDDAKHDPVVWSAGFGVVFLAKGPRTASIQWRIVGLGLYHSGLEGERRFRLVVKLT